MSAGLEILRKAAAGEIEGPPAATLLGWRALFIEKGSVQVEYTAREEFYNPHGVVQGGILAAMLDDAMGPALFTLLGEGQFGPTVEMKVNFARPAVAGKLMADGRVVHMTRRFAFLEGRLTQNGKLVATATATAAITGDTNGNQA